MFNTNLFSIRNIIVVAVIAVIWQILLTRAQGFLNQKQSSNATVSAS